MNPSPYSSNVELNSIYSSSHVENSNVSKWVGNKKMKRKAKKKNTKKKVIAPTFNLHVEIPPATGHHIGGIHIRIFGTRKAKFPCRLCKGDNLLKDCPGLFLVSEVWSKHPVSLVFDHHANDAPSTSDSLVKIQKEKVRYP